MQPPFKLGEGGRYEVSQQVSAGGTAIIYLAFDTVDREWRAIKMLDRAVAMRTDARKRLKAEYDALRTLDHPNVLKVFDAAIWGEEAWIVMVYAQRQSVGQWVGGHGPMPVGAALEVIRQTCLGVEHAHARGIIHRDIKPHNILVDGRGKCLVADFGIAAIEGTLVDRITRTGTALGTIGYVAPEQLDSAKTVDERADVYSLAATLFHLLTGVEPIDLFFTGPTHVAFQRQPDPIREVVFKGSQRKADNRYDSVAGLRRAIERLQMAHPAPLGAEFKLLEPPPPPPLPGDFGATIAPMGPKTLSELDADTTFDVSKDG